MGRHSASDDDADDASEIALEDAPTAVLTAPTVRGRHAQSEDVEPAEATTGPIGGPVADAPDGLLDPEGAAAAEGAADAEPSDETPERARGSSADLALVRRHTDVRARVAAGALVPVIIYVAIMAVVGATLRQTLLWVFIPLVVAGILVGYFLDVGHKRHAGGGDPPAVEH